MHDFGSVRRYLRTIVFEQVRPFRKPRASFQCGRTQTAPSLRPVDSEWSKSLLFSFNFSRVRHFFPGVAMQPLGFFAAFLEVSAS